LKKLSFVIPLKDDPLVDRLLNSLNKQTCRHFEVIIVDSSSHNYCLRDVSKWGKSLNLKVVSARCGRGTARNIGVRFTKTDILVFVDADVVLPENFVEEVVKLFVENPDLVAVGFPIYPTKLNRTTYLTYKVLNVLNQFSYRYGKPRIPTTCAGTAEPFSNIGSSSI